MHYQQTFQSKYFTTICPICQRCFPDILTSQKHIACDHPNLSLIPLMESEKLWVDKSIVLEPSAAKMKKLGVPIRKIKKDVMKKHLSDNETQTVSVAGSYKCVFPNCEKVFEMKEQFLIHLAISHFWKDLTLE